MVNITVCENSNSCGFTAAQEGEKIINKAINKNGCANIILATGVSQLIMLRHLIQMDINWNMVNIFHLDEYIGIDINHKASFRKYLKDFFVDRIEKKPKNIYYINPENGSETIINKLNLIISETEIDVAFVGIGENCHLAFNDPPANFDTKEPYIEVELDVNCRLQQLNEGWFDNFEEVPITAISMSCHQIMKSKYIICTVPYKVKANAVYDAFRGNIDNKYPASILQDHNNCNVYLDKESSALLY